VVGCIVFCSKMIHTYCKAKLARIVDLLSAVTSSHLQVCVCICLCPLCEIFFWDVYVYLGVSLEYFHMAERKQICVVNVLPLCSWTLSQQETRGRL